MCGIAGVFHYRDPRRQVDAALLARMTRALSHRGPDDEGLHVDGSVGLGHRRLAIVDLSPTGHQPMKTPDDSCWITYNGEFYNHGDFRRALAGKGHVFRGTSDTETLLYLLADEGMESLGEVAGIFAFAFWDGRKRELTLARDPLGVKQLYYHDDGSRIVFASEIKALLQCPDVPRVLDAEALNEYLHFHTPLFERTFFKHVRQLRPAEALQVTEHGARSRTYWRVERFGDAADPPDRCVAELREMLTRVVGQQLMSDVPVGGFFSGGVDSSAVAAYAIRAGERPRLFGVHFSGQGVIDERPYQEAAARALGLELELITAEGSSFPEDLARLLFCQDEPVIGAAMFPMYYVSRLAARKVKVCLGGQAGDEIFGGYARYALAQPFQVLRSWLKRDGVPAPPGASAAQVGGNLWKQLVDPRNLGRAVRAAGRMADWRARYFENFASVPEARWKAVFADGIVSRRACREVFDDTVARSPAKDPADAAMLWDLQTYLPGLFHQDDRMSMAHSLESRVPLADPRLVQFAFRLGFDLKFRAGASKWILRQAVADVIPAEVLNRRKVGFDTPAATWMKGPHRGFVRDVLLSSKARERGLWNPEGLRSLIERPGDPLWFDVLWKALCVEAWAGVFFEGSDSPRPAAGPVVCRSSKPERAPLGAHIQELKEMGLRHAVFRAGWELKRRSGLMARLAPPSPDAAGVDAGAAEAALRSLPFADPEGVARSMADRMPAEDLLRLERIAEDAAHGRILCFGRWIGDYGDPIDWHSNPVSGARWDPQVHWSRALDREPKAGDVKLSWEVARFPHAYSMARAATFAPRSRSRLARALAGQIEAFVAANPFGRGIHWVSGQESAFRLMTWAFALHVFLRGGEAMGEAPALVARHALESAAHIAEYLDYARRSVYNDHLLSEALGLLLASRLLPGAPRAAQWRRVGLEVLDEQAERQVRADGAYVMDSHNYHRVAMQDVLWAWALVRTEGRLPEPWRRAMERSLDFLLAHQNQADGRLPNHGANDGAQPAVLSTCDFADFRPTLQALSIAARGERIYDQGPWDEEAVWLLGPEVLDLPKRDASRRSVSFADSGYHVLRGRNPGSFSAFRCGSVKERFSHIDMLHLDVWWRGQNVLVDAGSYLYNGPPEWHNHFVRTGSHNTVQIDGRDQMLHHRRFKSVYWTRARTLRFEDPCAWAICEGEHDGYRRHPGGCVHRRGILFVKDDLWVVVDHVFGTGTHAVRLHWLCGDYPHRQLGHEGRVELETPAGVFSICVLGKAGRPAAGDVALGREDPPRGWLSRYYGEKVPVPSLVVGTTTEVPFTLVSVLAGGSPSITVDGDRWEIVLGGTSARFRIADGRFADIDVAPAT